MYDVVESRERGPDLGDRALLQWATTEDRILVTIDHDFGEFVFRDRTPHAGLIRLPDVPAAARIALMEQLLSRPSPEELRGAVVTIRAGRIRITRAP